jgi:hypothetical protein
MRLAMMGVGRELVESRVPVDASAEPKAPGGCGDGPAALAGQSVTVCM